MARKKKILVEDVLNLIEDYTHVTCIFYAYGMFYADSATDGMVTKEDCVDRLRYDCKRAQVGRIDAHRNGEDDVVIIHAEIVHD